MQYDEDEKSVEDVRWFDSIYWSLFIISLPVLYFLYFIYLLYVERDRLH